MTAPASNGNNNLKREIEEDEVNEVIVKKIKVDSEKVAGETDVGGDDTKSENGEPGASKGPSTEVDVKYPVKLNNLDKKATQKDLKKVLEGAGIVVVKIKKVFNLTYGVVWFAVSIVIHFF
jgi:hypothetical protein